ncbi:hypothetical protein KBG31_01655 [Patescibacteria group bacterium]|nr:hypothetical protein [Patescibacteria group bacterium]
MKLALLLHLYQPVTQSEEVFRKVYAESYAPLLKKIARTKDFSISIDLPLSLLEQMDRYGYSAWISDVKELVRLEKIEIVGSAAYHPLLSKLPKNFIEKQVILNEYGMGYYFGDLQNLEGEPAILLRNVVGFFPPELSVNERVLSVLDSLGYKWMIIDETSIPYDLNYQHKHGVYQFKDYSAKLVCRNRSFSNMLSFKRDLSTDDLTSSLKFFNANGKSFTVVMDGEFFGHHYGEGFLVLDKMLEACRILGIEITSVTKYVEQDCCLVLKDFVEASWGASDEEMSLGNVYPMWCDPENDIHKKQWDIIEGIISSHFSDSFITEVDDYYTLPVWDTKGLSRISNSILRQKIAREILLQKSLHSDQFWWASKKILPAGEYLYDPIMIKRGLIIIESYLDMLPNSPAILELRNKVIELKNSLAEK